MKKLWMIFLVLPLSLQAGVFAGVWKGNGELLQDNQPIKCTIDLELDHASNALSQESGTIRCGQWKLFLYYELMKITGTELWKGNTKVGTIASDRFTYRIYDENNEMNGEISGTLVGNELHFASRWNNGETESLIVSGKLRK